MKRKILPGTLIFISLPHYPHCPYSRTSNEKIRSVQYELLTARTEVEQTNEKVCLVLSFYTKTCFMDVFIAKRNQ